MAATPGPARGPKHILLGVTGGIAAYKAALIARVLMKSGHTVRVIPTPAATTFVGAATFAALTGQPATTGVFDDPEGVDHVRLGKDADLLLIAPATANTIAKLAAGTADNLLTSTALVATCPIVVAPAMHWQMWGNPAVQDNVKLLASRGYTIIDPATGPLTSGDTGVGRLPEPEEIVRRALDVLDSSDRGRQDNPGSAESDLAGRRIVITAGGTREPLDPVRFIGNRSTGRQGIALAERAAARGARVDLVVANVESALLPTCPNITVTTAETTTQLRDAVGRLVGGADAVIMAAAVADYRPVHTGTTKRKKDGSSPVIELVENPDILAGLAADRSHGALVVGFAAETGDESGTVLEYGMAKAKRKGADLLLINEVGEDTGFGDVANSVTIVSRDLEIVASGSGSKSRIADLLLDAVAERL